MNGLPQVKPLGTHTCVGLTFTLLGISYPNGMMGLTDETYAQNAKIAVLEALSGATTGVNLLIEFTDRAHMPSDTPLKILAAVWGTEEDPSGLTSLGYWDPEGDVFYTIFRAVEGAGVYEGYQMVRQGRPVATLPIVVEKTYQGVLFTQVHTLVTLGWGLDKTRAMLTWLQLESCPYRDKPRNFLLTIQGGVPEEITFICDFFAALGEGGAGSEYLGVRTAVGNPFRIRKSTGPVFPQDFLIEENLLQDVPR